MRPVSPRTHDGPIGSTGPELTPLQKDLLAAERLPPTPPAGLEARLWSRLEASTGAITPARPPGASGSLGKAWLLTGVAATGLIIAVTLALSGPKTPAPTSPPASATQAGSHETNPMRAPAIAQGSAPNGPSTPQTPPSPAAAASPEQEPTPSPSAMVAHEPSVSPTDDAQPSNTPAPPTGQATIGEPGALQPAYKPAQPDVPMGGRPPLRMETPMGPSAVSLGPAPAVAASSGAPPAPAAALRGPSLPLPSAPLAERALLTRARAALRDGAPNEAMTMLAEHQRRFARGELVQEREALRVHALAAAGRADEGRRARARFISRYPNSIHTPGLNALDL